MQDGSSSEQREVGHDTHTYGPVLPIVADAGVGPAKGIDIRGHYAYVILEGTVTIVDIRDANMPKIIGKLEGLGSSRQIQVRDHIAYIAARGDGLFLVDVSDPAQPSVLSHYDTIEFATGIALGGNIAFLACRLYGVELVDISDPHHPKHISVTRTGVSQSVAYADGFLYVGTWGDKVVVVVDVEDPRDPVITDKLPLDGYGDGVAVYKGHLYTATGQHSRAKPSAKPGDPGYGTGHGLEIYSLSNPAHPQLVSRTKFPPEYHTDSHLWTVRVANHHAFVADNYNGLFVLNVSDPAHPAFAGHHQLPYYADREGPAVVSDVSVMDDHIFIAGQYTDVHVIAAPGIATPVADHSGHSPVISPRPTHRTTEHYRAYDMDGQVYDVVCQENIGYI
ncbi:MAG: beta-propeller domain-containing protein, partial [Candidatus Latescibacteria bacterium]|nr:beta-propeller domain-containing protein [Candidatus Latescibacterota bacterium]